MVLVHGDCSLQDVRHGSDGGGGGNGAGVSRLCDHDRACYVGQLRNTDPCPSGSSLGRKKAI